MSTGKNYVEKKNCYFDEISNSSTAKTVLTDKAKQIARNIQNSVTSSPARASIQTGKSHCETAPTINQQTDQTITRSGRTVRKPAYLKEFVS